MIFKIFIHQVDSTIVDDCVGNSKKIPNFQLFYSTESNDFLALINWIFDANAWTKQKKKK